MKPLFRRGLRGLHGFWGGLSLCCLLVLTGCDRREITYYLESLLFIRADWQECRLSDEEERHGATTVVFANDATDARLVMMGTRDEEILRLPEGMYHAIIFNRSPDGFASIRFGGDAFDSYTAYARQVETRIDPGTRASSRVILTSPEELAADVVTSFSITEGMLGNYNENSAMNRNPSRTATDGSTRAEESDPERYVLRFTPHKLTRKVNVEIYFEGIHNIRSVVGTVDGVSESILIATAQSSPTVAVQQFVPSEIVFEPGSPFNGTLSGSFNVFGFDLTMLHTLALDILLVDNKTRIQQTLQGMAHETPDGNGELIITLRIPSPERLPDVKPEGDPDSGFDADVGDWGEPEEVPLE